MEFFAEHKTEIAALFVRLILGILFLFQGYDKIFRIGLKQTKSSVADAMQKTMVPSWLSRFITVASSLIEFSCGILLIAGWMIYPSLALLAFDLILVVMAMSLRESLWDMRFVWPRIVLIIFLFVIPEDANRFSFDHLLNTYGAAPGFAHF